MRVFLAGIIQGSYQGLELHDQSYRDRLKDVLRQHLPHAEVCCPIDMHPGGVDYAPDEQRTAFFGLVEAAAQADLLVAYLPQASLGTAIELWEAYHHGRVVVVITPMRENWVINLLAHAVLPSLEAFEDFVRDGRLAALLDQASRSPASAAERKGRFAGVPAAHVATIHQNGHNATHRTPASSPPPLAGSGADSFRTFWSE
jgi:O-acetyl-ADP-ribose deacetylase (regulator of RNase III)